MGSLCSTDVALVRPPSPPSGPGRSVGRSRSGRSSRSGRVEVPVGPVRVGPVPVGLVPVGPVPVGHYWVTNGSLMGH